MTGSINKVILVGNVGSQPEVRTTQASGEELVTFSIATNEKWKDKSTGEPKEHTEWHRIVVFASGLVRVVKDYVHKGSKLYVEGKMQTREYEDQGGIKRYTTEVVLTQYGGVLVLLDRKDVASGSITVSSTSSRPSTFSVSPSVASKYDSILSNKDKTNQSNKESSKDEKSDKEDEFDPNKIDSEIPF